MKWFFLTVVSVITAILLGAHFGFYKLTLVILQLSGTQIADYYFWCLMFLAVCFPLSNLLAFSRDNSSTRAYYYFSAVWIGSFFYLLLFTLVASLFNVVWPILWQTQFSPRWVLVIILLAVPVLLYAFRNAMIPRVRRVRVTIPGLPKVWRDRTVVFISDVHVGAILRGAFLQRVVNRIRSLNPDIVLIGGDLFDGGGSNMSGLLDPIDDLTPELGIHMITGNHETYAHHQSAIRAIRSKQINLMQNDMLEIDGLQLVGVDYPVRGHNSDPESVLEKLDKGKPTILMFHEPRRVELFKRFGVNLHLAGHTHRGQMWPFNHITKLVYKGLDYGLHTDGDFNLYCSCGVGTWGPPFRTMSRSEIVVIELK